MSFFDSIKRAFPTVTDYSSDNLKDFIPGVGDARAQERANEENIDAAARAMRFSERMSSTAYQRAMEDMRKAGLNPMLAFSQGGASTPTGTAPTIQAASKTRLGDTLLHAAGTGIQLKQQQARLDNESTATASNVKLQAVQAQQAQAAKADLEASAAKKLAETQQIRKSLPQTEQTSRLYDNLGKLLDGLGKSLGSSSKTQRDWSKVKLHEIPGAFLPSWLRSSAGQRIKGTAEGMSGSHNPDFKPRSSIFNK